MMNAGLIFGSGGAAPRAWSVDMVGTKLHLLAAALLSSSVLAHQDAGSHCGHDEVRRHSTGGVRNLGYTFNKAVPYADHGRRMQTATWAPIRIQVDYSAGATLGLSSALQTFLRDQLVPAAVQWIQQTLSVVPVTGTLKHARFCSSSYSSGTCASEGAIPTCGISSSPCTTCRGWSSSCS